MALSTLSQWPSIKLKSLFLPQKTQYLNNTLITRQTVAVSVKASSSSSVKKNNNSLIVIDNYDSFTYNLCQYIGELGCNFEVYRNDEITVDELRRKNPRGIVISHGPDKGISVQTILELGPSVPLFGVCLGLQCIGEAFGGQIMHSPSGAVLGKSSHVYYKEDGEEGLFAGKFPFHTSCRFTHLMGVQFHPESIITEEGKRIVGNFIKLIENMEADSQS